MDAAFKWLGAFATHNPGLIGFGLSFYLLWRLHQITDRQHDNAVETTKVLTAIKTFLITKFGGTVE